MSKMIRMMSVAAVITFSVLITTVSFSSGWKNKEVKDHQKQKIESQQEQQQYPNQSVKSAAQQLNEERLQISRQEYQKMQKWLTAKEKMAISSQTRSEPWQDSFRESWPFVKHVKNFESKSGLFAPVKRAAPNVNNVMLAPDLSIVSTYPENNTVDVPLSTEISVTFSEAIDKYAPLEITLFPEAKSVSDPEISPDGKTVSATSVLDTNMTYQLMVMNAVTPDSQWTIPQIGATFSTGSSLPAGSISGQVTLPLDPVTHVAFVAAFSAEMMDSEEPYRAAVITSGDGLFDVENLKAGDYMLLAIQDVNGDLQLNESDAISFYDADANLEPDIISVSEGQQVTDKDFQLTVFEVVSSYPPDSTLNVPTDTTLSVTFNLPVDINEGFDAILFPPPTDGGILSVSPDGKTLSVPITLEDNTVYQFLLLSAETTIEPRQLLKKPYLVYFSTGADFPTTTISGTVTFTDFRPSVALALLVPTDWTGGDEDILNISEINLEDGSYTIRNVEAGTYYPAFYANANDMEILSIYPGTVTVMEGETLTGIDMDLIQGADFALYGRVTDNGGISNVYVEASNKTNEDQRFEGDSNFLGYYRMMVSEGLYYLHFDPPEASGYLIKDIDNVSITTDTEINVTLESGVFIYGTVTNSIGIPLPEIYVEVLDAATQEWINGRGTDYEGEYRIGVEPGNYDVNFYPWQSHYVAEHFTNVDVTIDYELNVILQSGSLLDGIVSDGDATPLEGVGVTAFQSGTLNYVYGTQTDENGYYGFGLLPGTYDIHYDPRWTYPEYLLQVIDDVIVPPDTTINVLLEEGSTISGQITDPEDNPVADARVEVDDTDFKFIADYWTDWAGYYSLTVASGTYIVRVFPQPGNLAPNAIFDITVPPDTILNIQLQYPQMRTVTGTLTNISAASMDSIRLDIWNAWTFERSDTTITDMDGAYTVHLMDGIYSIIFRTGKWRNEGYPNQSTTQSFIPITSDTRLDFTLSPGYNLTGVVSDQDENPVEYADVSFLESVSARKISGATTDMNGNYSDLLVPNSYRQRTIPPPFSNLFTAWNDITFSGSEILDIYLDYIPFHDPGNVVFSWGAGKYGLSWNNGGQGFQYPPGQANNHLFRSYLLIAMSNDRISEEDNFQLLSVPNYTVTTPGVISDQDGYTLFDDRWSDFPVGVTVKQNSYAFADNPDNDYIILHLVIKNNDYIPKNIVTGMYFDWDVGSAADDMGNYDAAHNLGYIYSSDAPDDIHVGTAVLSSGGATSYRVYSGNLEGHLDSENQYTTMTEGFQQTSAGAGDLRYYIATGPVTLPAAGGDDSVVVAFALVAGDNLSDLQDNAAEAKLKYSTIASLEGESESASLPKIFSLKQNYPNPFNPSTKIAFALPRPEHVKIDVYNTLGQKIETLLDQKMKAGEHEIDFITKNLSSGIYFYIINAGEFKDVKKMILLR